MVQEAMESKGIGSEEVQLIKVPKYGLTIEVKNGEVISVFEEMPDKYSTLTPREKEILRLVGGKKSNREIAELLLISKRTVEIHRANIMRKLGISSMTDRLMSYTQSMS
jgi:DNA-binding CsgD family transcriptional regulator